MRILSLILGLLAVLIAPTVHAQSQSITPSANTTGSDADVTQSNSTSSTTNTTTQDQDVTNSSTNTVSGDQINNTYINQPASTSDNSSIRPRGGHDPLRARDWSDADHHDGGRGRDSHAAYDRDLLRAATPSQKEDLVDNKIEAQDDAIRAQRLLESSARGTYNAQSINNRAPDTGRTPRPVTGPAATVQFAPPQPATPIVVVPPVSGSGATRTP